MQNTEKSLEQKNEIMPQRKDAKTHSLVSSEKSQAVIQEESSQLSKNLSLFLMDLIKDVNEDGVTPMTVDASCSAANAIYKILRLNFEMKLKGF